MNVYGEIKGALSTPQTLEGALSSQGRIIGAMGAVHGDIKGSLSAPSSIVGKLSAPATIEGDLSIPSSVSAIYTGAYEFTPTRETQVININHKEALRNITINPIPQNYGLITYNGSIITVS
jgi:hypothetical protein